MKGSDFHMEDVDLTEVGSNVAVGGSTPTEMNEEESTGLVGGVARRQMGQGENARETPDSFMARPYSWYDPALIPEEHHNRT